MKNRFLLLFLFAFITISACKCEYIPTLKSSFEKADFVFIGEIEGITEVPSGFKTSQDILSKVRINKIYKSDYYNEFYKETATLFASPLRSCDVPFTEKGRFLIFAYFEEDTGLLYSSHCLLQKRMDQLSPGELKELETLSRDYKRVPENSQITTGGLTELIDDPSTPNRKINELKQEIADINRQNNRYKVIIYVSTFAIAMLLITLILVWKRKK